MEREKLISLLKKESGKTATDIEKALTRIEKSYPSELARKKVDRCTNIDEGKLFGVSINDAIKYLKTFNGELILEQRWSGYEDNYFVAISEDVENDDEYIFRLGSAIRREKELERKKAELARLKTEIAKLERDCNQRKSNNK